MTAEPTWSTWMANRSPAISASVERINPSGLDLFKRDDFIYDPSNQYADLSGVDAASKPVAEKWSSGRNNIEKVCCFNLPANIAWTVSSSLYVIPVIPIYMAGSVRVNYYDPYYQQMKQRMDSEEGKAAYRNRYKVEHKVADLARYCGMRRCRYRGLNKAKIHTLLAAIVSNVKRMARLLCPPKGEVCPKMDRPTEILVVAS